MKNYPIIHSIIYSVQAAGLESINFYLVETGQELMLVDAGVDTESCWNVFEQVLTDNGWGVEDIDRIILTHNHVDHIGLVNRIREKADIPVYAHPEAIVRLKREEAFMQQRIAFFLKLYKEMGSGAEADKQMEKYKRAKYENQEQVIKGEILTLVEGDYVNGFEVLEVPGHAPDHIVLFHPESGILLGGDLLMTHIRPNALIEPDHAGQRLPALIDYCKSLEKCRSYPISVIYPGHGNVIEKPYALLEQRLKEIDDKGERMAKMVYDGARTAAEVAKQFYQKKYETEFPLVMSQVIGHLDRLTSLGKLRIKQEDGVTYYVPV